jgi:hypothetical protein
MFNLTATRHHCCCCPGIPTASAVLLPAPSSLMRGISTASNRPNSLMQLTRVKADGCSCFAGNVDG